MKEEKEVKEVVNIDELDIIGETCPKPAPTTPPPGYAPNSTRYCEDGEWKWINGEIA